MAVNVRGFGTPLQMTALQPGTYFTAHCYGWTGLCLAIEGQEPLCVVLDYEGSLGDQAPTPRLLSISAINGRVSAVDADQLAIQPRAEKNGRPFMVAAGDVTHGSLVMLPSGEAVIAIRSHGHGNYSLQTGKSVQLAGGLAYAQWEIAFSEPVQSSTVLARFPEEDG